MRTIDLSGPEGNAFALLGIARSVAKQLGRDPEPILREMKSSDYTYLVEVFKREFGDLYELVDPDPDPDRIHDEESDGDN